MLQLSEPSGLSVDTIEDCIYVADTNNHCIRKVHLNSHRIETVCFAII